MRSIFACVWMCVWCAYWHLCGLKLKNVYFRWADIVIADNVMRTDRNAQLTQGGSLVTEFKDLQRRLWNSPFCHLAPVSTLNMLFSGPQIRMLYTFLLLFPRICPSQHVYNFGHELTKLDAQVPYLEDQLNPVSGRNNQGPILFSLTLMWCNHAAEVENSRFYLARMKLSAAGDSKSQQNPQAAGLLENIGAVSG